jgi:hypothetical protein
MESLRATIAVGRLGRSEQLVRDGVTRVWIVVPIYNELLVYWQLMFRQRFPKDLKASASIGTGGRIRCADAGDVPVS